MYKPGVVGMYYKPQGLLVGSNPGVIKKMILAKKIILGVDISVTLWSSS